MASPWIFICPSSRGISQALTLNLLRTTRVPVLATTRHSDLQYAKSSLLSPFPSSERGSISERLHLTQCDVTDESSVASAASVAKDMFPRDQFHLRLAFALPGVLTVEKSPEKVDFDLARKAFEVNALGGLMLSKYFMGFMPRKVDESTEGLPKHAVWVNMSARVGSTSDNRSGGWFSYRGSKAAVNSITKALDIHLRNRGGGSMAVAYHPGTVKTEFTKQFWGSVSEEKLFDVDDAAEKMRRVVWGLQRDDGGKCWDWKGEEILP